MIIPPEAGNDLPVFLRGLANGLAKQKAVIQNSQTTIGTIERPTVNADVPTPDGPDRRVYLLFADLRLLVLVQSPVADAHQQPEILSVLGGIRRTPVPAAP